MTEQGFKDAIQRLVEHPGNNECAECYLPNPSYCSITLGIFLCPICAKLHQKSIPKLSKVVAILNNKWRKEDVDFLYKEGNKIVNAKYEKLLPIYYHRPRPDDPDVIFEQWILAKYVREEFTLISQQSSYNQGTKTGALFKRAKDQDKFQRRKFILSEPDGKLQYFIKYSDKHPKDSIAMRNMVNVYMVPDKVGNENGMQVTYEKDGVRRNLYVFGEDGKSTSDWYHAIRASMARHKYKDFPDNDVKRYINSTIIREGWMSKTGPRKQEKFRKRWFSLVGTAIWYYVNPLDAHPLGYISLGSKTFGYGVMRGFPKGIREEGYGMTVHTPERVFVLNLINMDSRERWVTCIEQVLASCTTVWTKPSIGRLGHEDSSIINVDDIPDLVTPSTTTVFTEMPSDEAIEIGNGKTSSSEDRMPLFEKNTRVPRNVSNVASKINSEKKEKHGGTVKIKKEVKTSELRAGSKRYSDDSDYSDSDGEVPKVVQASPIHKQASRILKDLKLERSRMLSSATDEDSDEEVVVINRMENNQRSDEGFENTNKTEGSETETNFMSLTKEFLNSTRQQNVLNVNRHSLPTIDSSQIPGRISPVARPRSVVPESSGITSGTSTPKKPPRRKVIHQDSDTTSTSSEFDTENKMTDLEQKMQPFFNFSQEYLYQTLSPAVVEVKPEKTSSTSSVTRIDSGDAENSGTAVIPTLSTSVGADSSSSGIFTSIRRVQGKERKTLKNAKGKLSRIASLRGTDSPGYETSELVPRPIDVTIANYMDTSIWFMLFQCEQEADEVDSYVTPWLGAEIAEMPASVGPIGLPSEFEIAVIDTAPGGFGLQRTTGPYYTEPGDVWEVEIPVDDGSAPDMFYHEGMETDDGSVMVYSSVENSKKFEIAIFKSGRKLFCRKNIKPGESVGFKVQPTLYVMQIDQESYYEMQGDDIRVMDILPKASKIELNFRIPKTKIGAKKRGDNIYFTSNTMRYQSRK